MTNERINILLSMGAEVYNREVDMGDFFMAVNQMDQDRWLLAGQAGRPNECVLSVGPTGNLITSVFVFKKEMYG